MIYIREAHPMDGWRMESNDQAGVVLPQPRTGSERAHAAGQFCSRFETDLPVLIDDIDDRADSAYSGFPDRLYVIDREGRVAFKSGRGPVGFDTDGLEVALILTLLAEELKAL